MMTPIAKNFIRFKCPRCRQWSTLTYSPEEIDHLCLDAVFLTKGILWCGPCSLSKVNQIKDNQSLPPLMGKVSRCYRTLIRVERIKPTEFWITIPAWDVAIQIHKELRILPIEIQMYMLSATFPIYLHARINLDAESAESLEFAEWEIG